MVTRDASAARSYLSKILYTGIDNNTPPHLVDRVVYSNWVCLIGTFINVIEGQTNWVDGYTFLFFWSVVFQLALVSCWTLNHRRSYLAGRLTLVSLVFVGLVMTCAYRGPSTQTEHFLLAFSALAFTLFHPSERVWAWLFGGLSAAGFLFLVRQTGPILHLHSGPWVRTAEDLKMNQISFTLLFVLSLIALSNAYARATQVADEQRAKLFESNKLASLGQMAGGIAHEINNPIAVVLALAERLSRQAKAQDLSSDEIIKASEKIQDTAFRIVHIVRGLQALSRDGEKLPFSPSSVHHIIEDTVALCRERFKSLGIELSVLKSPEDVFIDCRAIQISQALLNLLNNACDATRGQKEKWVKVGMRETNSKIEIYVKNSGDKISREVQEKLFQPFFTTKEVGRGTGLGLSISLAMILKNGGSLYLDESCSDTCFVVSFPKQMAPAPALLV